MALACFCLLYFGSTFSWVFAVLVGVHFFTSAQMPVVEALTLNEVREAPGRYGRIRVWGSVGFIAAVLGLGALLDLANPRAVLHVVSGLLFITIIAAWLVPHGTGGQSAAARGPVGPILRRAEVRAFLCAGALNAFAHAALYTFYSIYLADHGYSKTTIGIMWALGVVIEIGVFQAMPQIMRRFDPAALFFSTFVVCAVRFLIIGWCVDYWWLLVLAQLMHASTFAIYHASAVSLVGRYFGAENQARGQALYISLSFGAGGFAGGIVSGAMWERAGPAWTYTLSAVAGALGVVLLAVSGQRGAARVR
jgi:PPP family 3-phenylpropionic acid transporter